MRNALTCPTVAHALMVPAALCLASTVASAQTIRPIVSEFQTRAQGKFELVNDSDRPLNVVVEPKGFTVDANGEMRDAPLPTSVHVKLSTSSFRLPARQGRTVFYDATSDRTPAWLVLYANISGFPRRDFSGLSVQLELPHIVYILSKTRWTGTDVQVAAGQLDRGARTLALDLLNRGTEFGRISALEIRNADRVEHVKGFALFPGMPRRLSVHWDGEAPPESVIVRSRDFSVERTLALVDR